MKLSNQIKRKKQSGFTLVELVVVMTIIVVLAGSGIFLVTGIIDDARVQTADNNLKALDVALKSYERNNYGKPPTQEQGLAALTERPTSGNVPKRWRAYLEEPMLDPWGNEYQYRFPAQKSKRRYDIWSLGEDGVESEDDIGNW
ncbi:MAG: type II secretion system major pseudopilin GspG [Verrucomicrobiales bacterium]|nr:type II secretion system major pseudopilin GspG [Verrucomicrobiales bacterium]